MSLARLTTNARQVLLALKNAAPEGQVDGAVLFKALQDSPGLAKQVLSAMKLTGRAFAGRSANLAGLVETAYAQAMRLKHPYVGTEHLLLGYLDLVGSAHLVKAQQTVRDLGTYPNDISVSSEGSSFSSSPSSFISHLTSDLTLKATREELPLLIRRPKYLNKLSSILLKRHRNNPLLVGGSGVGKTSLVYNLAQEVVNYRIPRPLMGTSLIRLNWGTFISSPLIQHNLLGAFSLLLEEASRSSNTILFLDNLQLLSSFSAGGYRQPSPLLSLLEEAMSSGLRVIGAIDHKNAGLITDSAIGLNKHFQSMVVSELSKDEVLAYLNQMLPIYEEHHQVEIKREIINSLVELSQRYLPEQPFPGKVLDILDQACAQVHLEREALSDRFLHQLERFEQLAQQGITAMMAQDYDQALELRTEREKLAKRLVHLQTRPRRSWGKLDKHQVLKVLSDIAGVPMGDLTKSEAGRYLRLEKELSHWVVGQEEAVRAVSRALRRARLRLGDKSRPVGNFLFLGPTGVGKTHLARVVASTLFGDDSFLKLDMSGFRERHAVSRLIGAPPGYIGYDEGGELVNFVQDHPYSVILFDEIDKAHPEVLNILLQIMEDGVLTDGQGNSADFSNVVVILTSNFGSDLIGKGYLGFKSRSSTVSAQPSDTYTSMKERLLSNLKRVLKPEFINRLDEAIVFHRLTADELYQVCTQQSKIIASRFAEKNIKLKILPTAKKLLVGWGTSDEYGARPLRRLIEDRVLGPLSEMLLKEEVREGDSVKVRGAGEEIKFEISHKK